MGIVGLGRIGTAMALRAKAIGMDVQFYDPYKPDGFDKALGIRRCETLEELLETVLVVSLHCPLTARNEAFVNAKLLERMKRTAFLINTARGPLVDEAALAAALNAGTVAGAALDVISVEPMRPDNPLRTARNCIITPHIAWASVAARRRLMAATVHNVRAFLDGQPVNVVNESGNEMQHWRIWVDTKSIERGPGSQIDYKLEGVEIAEGYGFFVEVRHPVPAADRGEYAEYSNLP